MDNHYHLLIETPDGNPSPGMRQKPLAASSSIICKPQDLPLTACS
jgi:hypothetical protein